MNIGCVKEIKNNEYRVGLTPDNAKAYIDAGHKVYVEKGAGVGSGFLDDEYAKYGVTILENPKDVWDKADMMVKVKEPLEEEYAYFHEGLILYNVHKNGAKLVDKLYDATMYQKYFLFLMSAEDINYQNSIEHKLIGIAKGVGIEFKK